MMRILLSAIALASPAIAQDGGVINEANIGSLASGDAGGALQGQYTYKLETSQELGGGIDEDNGIVAYTDWFPQVELRYSDGPTFNSVFVSIAGYHYRGGIFEEPGSIPTPANTEPFSIFPFSFGLETDQSFDNAAVIAEIGYVPVGRQLEGEYKDKYRLGFNPEIGVFLQAGYKSNISSESDTGNGADQSAEEPDSGIARLKLVAEVTIPFLDKDRESDEHWFILDLSLTGWYDITNEETYHRNVATLKLMLSESNSLDFVYEDGAGAPNFNEGERFGAFLSVSF